MCPWLAPACSQHPGKGERDCQLRWGTGWGGAGNPVWTCWGSQPVQLFPADERALTDMAQEQWLTPKVESLPGSPVGSRPEVQWVAVRREEEALPILWTTQRGQDEKGAGFIFPTPPSRDPGM